MMEMRANVRGLTRSTVAAANMIGFTIHQLADAVGAWITDQFNDRCVFLSSKVVVHYWTATMAPARWSLDAVAPLET
jgi:hypothetical protein